MRILKAILLAFYGKGISAEGDTKSVKVALPYGYDYLVKCHTSLVDSSLVDVTINGLRQSLHVDYVVLGHKTMAFMHDLYEKDIVTVTVRNSAGTFEKHECQL